MDKGLLLVPLVRQCMVQMELELVLLLDKILVEVVETLVLGLVVELVDMFVELVDKFEVELVELVDKFVELVDKMQRQEQKE